MELWQFQVYSKLLVESKGKRLRWCVYATSLTLRTTPIPEPKIHFVCRYGFLEIRSTVFLAYLGFAISLPEILQNNQEHGYYHRDVFVDIDKNIRCANSHENNVQQE